MRAALTVLLAVLGAGACHSPLRAELAVQHGQSLKLAPVGKWNRRELQDSQGEGV